MNTIIKELEYLRRLSKSYEENERINNSNRIIKNLRSSIQDTLNYIYKGENMFIDRGDVWFDSWNDIIDKYQKDNLDIPSINEMYLLCDNFFDIFDKFDYEPFYYKTNFDNRKLFFEQFEIINLIKINIVLGVNLYEKLYFNPKKKYSHHISKFEIINSPVYYRSILKNVFILSELWNQLPEDSFNMILLYLKPIKEKTYFLNEKNILNKKQYKLDGGIGDNITIPETVSYPWYARVWSKKEEAYINTFNIFSYLKDENYEVNLDPKEKALELKGDKFVITDSNKDYWINNLENKCQKIYFELKQEFTENNSGKSYYWNEWWYNKEDGIIVSLKYSFEVKSILNKLGNNYNLSKDLVRNILYYIKF